MIVPLERCQPHSCSFDQVFYRKLARALHPADNELEIGVDFYENATNSHEEVRQYSCESLLSHPGVATSEKVEKIYQEMYQSIQPMM